MKERRREYSRANANITNTTITNRAPVNPTETVTQHFVTAKTYFKNSKDYQKYTLPVRVRHTHSSYRGTDSTLSMQTHDIAMHTI